MMIHHLRFLGVLCASCLGPNPVSTPPPSWQWLVLWLDCDREGENIACDVRDRCLAVRKRVKVYRGRFSALIPQVGTSARM